LDSPLGALWAGCACCDHPPRPPLESAPRQSRWPLRHRPSHRAQGSHSHPRHPRSFIKRIRGIANARASIRGVIKVAVRVTVDRSGNVTDARLAIAIQQYLPLRSQCRETWKFAPALRAPRLAAIFRIHPRGTTAQATLSRLKTSLPRHEQLGRPKLFAIRSGRLSTCKRSELKFVPARLISKLTSTSRNETGSTYAGDSPRRFLKRTRNGAAAFEFENRGLKIHGVAFSMTRLDHFSRSFTRLGRTHSG